MFVLISCCRYLTSYDDLIGYLTTMHQGTMVPSVIVIDDLHLFLHSDNCQVTYLVYTLTYTLTSKRAYNVRPILCCV